MNRQEINQGVEEGALHDTQHPHDTPVGGFVPPDPAELSSLMLGYEVSQLIACGGMGAVYQARQTSLDRDVAIKILPREFGADPDFRAAFEAEAKAMARLNHPNLIGVHDFGEIGGFLFIIMEMVPGKSLYHSAHGRAIEQGETARLMHGICQGLAHAHDAGIIHRDIKPANILLDSDKNPRIGDFGLARPVDAAEGEGMSFGTPDYTAPEVMKNPDNAGKRSDVFAVGVILHELLTGKLPGASYVPVSQGNGINPRFDKILRRALHPAPAMRFADAGEMARELGALVDVLGKPLGGKLNMAVGAARPAQQGAAGPKPAAVPAAGPQIAINPYQGLGRKLVIIAILLVAIAVMAKIVFPPGPKSPTVDTASATNIDSTSAIIGGAVTDTGGAVTEVAIYWGDNDGGTSPGNWDTSISLGTHGGPFSFHLTSLAPNTTYYFRCVATNSAGSTWASSSSSFITDQKVVPPPPPPSPDVDPMEDLARLKQNLVAGERGEFPPGTNKRGDSWFFVVDTPKSWRDASIFAEAHGGHLATLADETEQAWLSNKVPEDTMVWLGGVCTGGKEWRWIDGSKWLVNNPFTGTVKFACLSDLGTLRSKARGEQLKFVIQWRQNGKNPGSLDSQLGRLKASLGGGGEPLYPAETLSRLGSHYLIVERALSWSDAVRFAEDLDGYLGVPEDKAESTFLREAVTEALPHGSAAWIGGEFKGGRWVWATTGERVSFGDWVGNSPDGNEEQDIAMRIVAGNGAVGGWDDADPDDRGAISAFVIEWGKVNRDLGQNPDLRPVDDVLNERRDKAQELVKDAQDDHAKKLLANGDSMRKDLNFWQAGLPRGAIKGKMAVAVALVNGLVDATGRIGDPPPGMRVFILPAGYKIWQDAVAEQKKIDADHEAELDRFRRFYLSNLQKDLDAVQEAGMKPEVRTIQKEIDACGPDGQSFLLHLEGEP